MVDINNEYRECQNCVHRFHMKICNSCEQPKPTNFAEDY